MQPAPILVRPVTWTWEISLQFGRSDLTTNHAIRTDGCPLADHSAVFNPRGWIDLVIKQAVSQQIGVNCPVFQWLARAAGAVQ